VALVILSLALNYREEDRAGFIYLLSIQSEEQIVIIVFLLKFGD